MNNKNIILLAALIVPTFFASNYAMATAQMVNVTDGNIVLPELPPLTLTTLFGDMSATAIFLVLTIAVTFRQSSEAIAKWINGEITFFDRKYIAYAIIAFVSSLPLGMGLFGEAAKVFLLAYGTWGFIGGLFMVAIYGYGWQHLTNKTASLVGHFLKPKTSEEKAPTTTTTDQPTP